MANSAKNKGSGGERQAAVLLMQWAAEIGCPLIIERNLEQVRAGGADLNGVPNMEIEVKRQETLNVSGWWKQVLAASAKSGKVPMLMWRQNRGKWRFKTRQYVAIYGKQTCVAELDFEMDLASAKNWFQHFVYVHMHEAKNNKK